MKKLLLCFIVMTISFASEAQYQFRGYVMGGQMQPLQGASISLGKKLQSVTSDANGFFEWSDSVQQRSINISYVGYSFRLVTLQADITDTIFLQPQTALLEEAVVRAFERNSSTKDAPVAVTALGKQSLQRFGNVSLVGAVNTVPGVKMDERSPGSYRLSIRGNLLRSTFGVRNVKVYWNGIPFTDASGNTYLNQVSLNNIDRMEIIKGPSGSMYGSGTGGVVLLSSGTKGIAKDKNISLQAGGGSYGLLSGSVAYQQTGNAATAISFNHQQSDGYRTHSNMRRDVVHYTGSYVLSAKQTLNANIFYSDLYYQTPGGLTRAELNVNPRQARPAAGIFQSAETQKAALYLKTIYAGLSHEYAFSDRWNNTSSLYSSYTDFKNPTIRNFEQKAERGLGGRSVFQYQASKFTGTFGAEFQTGLSKPGVYGNRAGVRDTLQFNARIGSRQLNVFAQAEWALPAGFVVNGGLSYNSFYYEYKKELAVETQSSPFEPQFIPRFSLMKKFAAINIYAAVSKGYSVPSIDEVVGGNDQFNSSLEAETAINYELGLKGDLIKNKLWADLALYVFSLQNTIVGRRDAGGGDFYSNAGKTKQKGAELSVNYLPVNRETRFLRMLKITGSVTHINARFKDYQQGSNKYDGNKLTGTAPNVFVFAADAYTGSPFYSNFTFTYTDHIPLNDANSFFAKAYQLAFIKLGYKKLLSGGTELHYFATAEKSFNNPYSLGNDLNAAGNRFFNLAAPQNFTLGIQCRFRVK